MSAPFKFSIVESKRRLSKSYTLDPGSGELRKAPGGVLTEGALRVESVADLQTFGKLVTTLTPHEMLVLGTPKAGLEKARVLTANTLHLRRHTIGEVLPDTIARTKECIGWNVDAPGLVLFDHDDADGASPEDVWEQLAGGIQELRNAGAIAVPSSSYGICRASDGLLLTHKEKFHIYCVLERHADAEKIKRFIEDQRIGYKLVRAKTNRATGTASTLRRYIVDTAVFSPERPDFCGGVVLGEGLYREAPAPRMIAFGGIVPPIERGGGDKICVPGCTFDARASKDTQPAAPVPPEPVGDIPAEDEAPAPEPARERGNLYKIWRNRTVSTETKKDIEQALAHIPADVEYTFWMPIMGVLSRLGRWGWDIAIQWSQSVPRGDSTRQLERKLGSLKNLPGDRHGADVGKIFSIAREFGWVRGGGTSSLDAKNAALPPLPPLLPVEEAVAQVRGWLHDAVRAPQPGLHLLQSTTGTGKSAGLAEALREWAETADEDAHATVYVKNHTLAAEMAERLPGLAAVLHGREDFTATPDRAAQAQWPAWRCVTQYPPQPGNSPDRRVSVSGAFFQKNQSLGCTVCHATCATGQNRENRLLRERGEPTLPDNPFFPDRCFLDHRLDVLQARVRIVVGGNTDPAFYDTAWIFCDEEESLPMKAGRRYAADFLEAAEAAQATAGMLKIRLKNESSDEKKERISRQISDMNISAAHFLEAAQKIVQGDKMPDVPAQLLEPEYEPLWEKPVVSRDAIHALPEAWTRQYLSAHMRHVVSDHAPFAPKNSVIFDQVHPLVWDALAGKKSVIVMTATPSLLLTKIATTHTRILAHQGIALHDPSETLGLAGEKAARVAARVAPLIQPDEGVIAGTKDLARELRARLSNPERVLHEAAGGVGVNTHAGKNVFRVGIQRKPDHVVQREYDEKQVVTAALTEEHPHFWTGGWALAGPAPLPDAAECREWHLYEQARRDAQAHGRSRSVWDRSLTTRTAGGLDTVALQRTAFGIDARHEAILPRENLMEKLYKGAAAVAAEGGRVSREALRVAGGSFENAAFTTFLEIFGPRFAAFMSREGAGGRAREALLARIAAVSGAWAAQAGALWAAMQAEGGRLVGAEPDEEDLAALLWDVHVALTGIPAPPG